jgi:O-antigen/teichoic acid export membrane protein
VSEIDVGEALPGATEPERDALPRRLGIAALAHDAAIYGGTRVLLKSLTFILVPVYAHFVTPREFGVLELILAVSAFVDAFINLPGLLARFYFDRDERLWRRQTITAYLLIEASYPAVLIGVLIALASPLSNSVAGVATYAPLFAIALVDLYLTNIVDLPMNLCRLRGKPKRFALYSLARGLTQIVLTVILLVAFDLGIKGILIASLVSVCVAFVLTLPEYVFDLTKRFAWRTTKEMLAFAWPTIISAVAFYALNLADRLVLKQFHGLEANGLYGTAFRYSQVVVVGVFAFRMGWPQWHYSWLLSGRHPEAVARGASFYFAGIGFLAVALSAWILPFFHLVMPETYWPATRAVAPLALAGVGMGAFTVFTVGFNVTKRVRLITVIALVGGGAAMGLYYLLIPPFSFVGAAWATATAFAVICALAIVIERWVYPIPWQWSRLAKALGTTLALCLACLAVDAWVELGPSLALRVALTAAFPTALLSLRFFSPGELAAIRGRVRILRRSRG